MNEELQSTNEELVTSKEELQSTNEELTTLNAQLQEKVQELTVVNEDLANLLVSTDIVTVFLDADLCVKRFTTVATQLLNLLPSDVGRPITHIATTLLNVDLPAAARSVLDVLAPIEREVAAQGDRQFVLRLLPYRASDNSVKGVVLTLVDVTALKTIERELRATKEEVSADLRRMSRLHNVSTRLAGAEGQKALLEEILAAAIDITGADTGTVQIPQESGHLTIAAQIGFEQPFLDYFDRIGTGTESTYIAAMASRRNVMVEDVSESPVFAGKPSLNVLATAGVRAVQSTPLMDRNGEFVGVLSTYFRKPHPVAQSEQQWLDLLGRQAADLIVRHKAGRLLAAAKDELEQRVADRTKWLTLVHEVTRAINDAPSWDEGLQLVLRLVCDSEDWQIGYVYLPDRNDPNAIVPAISHVSDERFQPFHENALHQSYQRDPSLPGRAYAGGDPIWVNDPDELLALIPTRRQMATRVGLKAAAALPIRFGNNVIAVLELFSDRSHPPNDVLVNLMNDVSIQIGKVLERERSMAEMADLAWREQQDLLHTLHDSLGQTLAGLGMQASALSQRATAGDTAALADTAKQISQQAQLAIDEVRQLAKNLFPAEIEPQSLMAALHQLASTTGLVHKIRVKVEGTVPEGLRDGAAASQLYRIAQEALTNVVKHAQARTVTISIGNESGLTILRIVDDGIGIQNTEYRHNGVGLGIMRYRAQSIGGSLVVEAGAKGGTMVTCTVRGIPHAGVSILTADMPTRNQPSARP
jgi:signal transduction histidine kinase